MQPEQAILPNAGFYQASAGLLGVLLLTGVVAELRATRDRDEMSDRQRTVHLFIFLALSFVVLAGELAALTVLLRQRTSPLLQTMVGLSLVLGLFGVPALAFLDGFRQFVSSQAQKRARRAAAIATALGVTVVFAFVAQAVLTGDAGVGTPTPPASGAGQIEGGNIARASATGAPGASFTDPLDARVGSRATVGMRVSNPGPKEISDVRVVAALPNAAGGNVAIVMTASASNANPGTVSDNVRLRSIGGRPICVRYVPGSTRLRLAGGGDLRALEDGIAETGVDIGNVDVPLSDVRVVTFEVSLESTSSRVC